MSPFSNQFFRIFQDFGHCPNLCLPASSNENELRLACCSPISFAIHSKEIFGVLVVPAPVLDSLFFWKNFCNKERSEVGKFPFFNSSEFFKIFKKFSNPLEKLVNFHFLILHVNVFCDKSCWKIHFFVEKKGFRCLNFNPWRRKFLSLLDLGGG